MDVGHKPCFPFSSKKYFGRQTCGLRNIYDTVELPSPRSGTPLKRAPRAIEINGVVVFEAKKVIIRAKTKWTYGGVPLYFNTI